VETDVGKYAASIPSPARPRASLAAGDVLPDHVSEADVRRANHVFDSVREGPTLRLLVDRHDVRTMLLHALWVAKLRLSDIAV